MQDAVSWMDKEEFVMEQARLLFRKQEVKRVCEAVFVLAMQSAWWKCSSSTYSKQVDNISGLRRTSHQHLS